MSRKMVAPFFLLILSFGVTGFLLDADVAAAGPRTLPVAGWRGSHRLALWDASRISSQPARMEEYETPDGDEWAIAFTEGKPHDTLPALFVESGSECTRTVAPNRHQCKTVSAEQSGCLPDIRLSIIIGRHNLDQISAPPLAVVMPNPRSPPTVLLSIPCAALV